MSKTVVWTVDEPAVVPALAFSHPSRHFRDRSSDLPRRWSSMVDSQRVIQARDGLAVVTLPAEVDIASSRRLCGELGFALSSARTVIVDMTASTSCHSSGVRILLLAYEQAAATGVELR